MKRLFTPLLLLSTLLLGACSMTQKSETSSAAPPAPRRAAGSKVDTLPRKVVVATSMARFAGTLEERTSRGVEVVEAMAAEAARMGKGLDLCILPEYAICAGKSKFGKQQAVPLEGAVSDTLGGVARKHHTYLIVPMIMREGDGSGRASNAAVLFGRDGKVAGIYRKVHVVADLAVKDRAESLEGGLTPGSETPVFNCDFGKLGIQICWDNCYPDGWKKLADQGAEIVAWPTASPANIRAAYYAQQHSYYVASATPRDNAAIYNPTGMYSGQVISEGQGWGKVLVREIDLSYAILGWTAPLEDGASLSRKYGDRVGYQYSPREDEGLFWSNDPHMTIGQMVRDLGLLQFGDHLRKSLALENDIRAGRP